MPSKKKVNKRQKINKFIYWTPRILSIIFILFLAVFSLDVFDEKLGFWGTLLGLFMHNIPSLVLLMSWKNEIVGGIVFILAGLLYTALSIVRLVMSSPSPWSMTLWSLLLISGPAFLIGILFLINWFQKKK